MIETLFPIFCIFTLACASAVVLAKNPVYSAFALILSLFGLAVAFTISSLPRAAAAASLVQCV